MNCTQFNKILDDYIDGSLLTIQLSHAQLHLNECTDCQRIYSQANCLLTTLKDIPVPPAKVGYEKRVLSFLNNKQEKQTPYQNLFFAGFSGAVAASFALWLILSPVSQFSPPTENMKTVNLLIQKQQTIDLVFNLASELPDATLTIKLPEKVEIAGYSGKRQLIWTTSLKQGPNRLALPLIARNKNNGILIATLSKNGKTKTFKIKINSHPPASSFFQGDVSKQPKYT
ncbi:MAG: hypothetical protein QM484_08040 [Woeseiaceae bacterium]